MSFCTEFRSRSVAGEYVGQLVVLERDDRPHLRGRLALRVGETGADLRRRQRVGIETLKNRMNGCAAVVLYSVLSAISMRTGYTML